LGFTEQFLKKYFKGSFSESNSIIGLDIGSLFVKAISVERDKQQFTITGFCRHKVEANKLSDTVKDALASIPTKKKEICVSVSGQGVVLRYVNLPLMNKTELEKSISFEIEKYIPFPVSEIYFDFYILRENRNASKMLVLFAAAKKEVVDSRIKLCKELGYQVISVDIDSVALANYFEKIHGVGEGVYAVINIGASFTLLDVIEDGVLVLSREINVGGNDFYKAIVEHLGKDAQDMEALVKGGFKQDTAPIIEEVLNNLINGIKISFDFYECSANRVLDKVFITGGAIIIPGLIDFLKHSFDQEICRIVPAENSFKIAASLKRDDFIKEADFFSIASGMVLR